MKNETQGTDYKIQEEKFVKWSEGTNATTYDVVQIIRRLSESPKEKLLVLDIGGGIGTVARAIADSMDKVTVDVIDNSSLARRHFVSGERVNLVYEDFLTTKIERKYDAIIFRTVLHHIVTNSSRSTKLEQSRAIAKAFQILADDGMVFTTENFYEPFFFDDISGEIIFQLTKSKTFAPLFRRLGANTAGEGVRFRSYKSWITLFKDNAFEVTGEAVKEQRQMPTWQKWPFLCKDTYQALLEFRKCSSA